MEYVQFKKCFFFDHIFFEFAVIFYLGFLGEIYFNLGDPHNQGSRIPLNHIELNI